MVPHAHNTYLDQMLSLGVTGSLLYGGTLIGGCMVAWRRFRASPDETSLLPALLLTWVALLSLTESVPVAPYLPTLIAYSSLVKLCMVQGSEREVDRHLRPGEVLSRLPGRAEAAQHAMGAMA